MSDTPVKVLVDCSLAGPPDPEFAASFREAALAAIENGDLEKATKLMQEAKDLLAASAITTFEIVELTPDEQANLTAIQQAASEDATVAHRARLDELVAQCDRYLAQTDWIMVPAAARPTDMSPSLAQACDDNQKAWAAWRSSVKAIRDAAVAGTADPDQPGFPDQPAAPEVVLA
jgi:hypothetical protein